MSDNQKKAIDLVKFDRTLTGARNLYNNLPGKSLAYQAGINRMRGTDENVKRVCYEIFKLVGLQERQLLALWQNKVQQKDEDASEEPKKPQIDPKAARAEKIKELLKDFDPDQAKWPVIMSVSAELSDIVEKDLPGLTKVDRLAFIADARKEVIKEETKEIPAKVRESIALRTQFPFLKKEDCPVLLKALVNDLITAYENYRSGHEQLFEQLSEEDEKLIAENTVKNFIENKQAFAELEHYKETGEILGEHKIFAQEKIKEELRSLSTADLTKKEGSLRKNISTNNTKAEKEEDAEKKAGYLQKVEDYTWQHEFVKEELNKR